MCVCVCVCVLLLRRETAQREGEKGEGARYAGKQRGQATWTMSTFYIRSTFCREHILWRTYPTYQLRGQATWIRSRFERARAQSSTLPQCNPATTCIVCVCARARVCLCVCTAYIQTHTHGIYSNTHTHTHTHTHTYKYIHSHVNLLAVGEAKNDFGSTIGPIYTYQIYAC
jgi:hypothetical protein